MNAMGLLGFELAYNDIAVYHLSHYIQRGLFYFHMDSLHVKIVHWVERWLVKLA